MKFSTYFSPIGEMLIVVYEGKLVGLWFCNQKYFMAKYDKTKIIFEDNEEMIIKTKDWLDRYFLAENPSIKELNIEPRGSEFQRLVWDALLDISYGEVMTYQDISMIVKEKKKLKNMSCQAIGGAISHNPISIIIPCHRVVGKNGTLVGYAGGLERKEYLLNLEKRGKDV